MMVLVGLCHMELTLEVSGGGGTQSSARFYLNGGRPEMYQQIIPR